MTASGADDQRVYHDRRRGQPRAGLAGGREAGRARADGDRHADGDRDRGDGGGGGRRGGGGGALAALFEGGGPPAATCAKSSVRFGDVEVLAACFSPKGRANVATGRVRVNGLDLVPVRRRDRDRPRAADDHQHAAGAGASPATIPLYAGRIDWDLSSGRFELPIGADAAVRLHPPHRDGDGRHRRARALPDRRAAADRLGLRALRGAARRGLGREPAAAGHHGRRGAAHRERARALARGAAPDGGLDPDRPARGPRAGARLRARGRQLDSARRSSSCPGRRRR